MKQVRQNSRSKCLTLESTASAGHVLYCILGLLQGWCWPWQVNVSSCTVTRAGCSIVQLPLGILGQLLGVGGITPLP